MGPGLCWTDPGETTASKFIVVREHHSQCSCVAHLSFSHFLDNSGALFRGIRYTRLVFWLDQLIGVFSPQFMRIRKTLKKKKSLSLLTKWQLEMKFNVLFVQLCILSYFCEHMHACVCNALSCLYVACHLVYR